jgi:hypothetical protein
MGQDRCSPSFVFIIALLVAIPMDAGQPAIQPLGRAGTLVREIQPGEDHHYELSLQANEFCRVVVEQQGIDVVMEVAGPDGRERAFAEKRSGRKSATKMPSSN